MQAATSAPWHQRTRVTTEEQLIALVVLLVGAVVYLAKRPVKAVAPVAPVAPVLPLAAVHDWSQEIERIDSEIARLREWRHDVSSTVGAISMLPNLMRSLAALRERVARLEARLMINHEEGTPDA